VLDYLGLAEVSGGTLSLIFVAVGLFGILAGGVTDAIMGDRGFGMFGNGLLIVMGCLTGLYAERFFFGVVYPRDIVLTGICAACGATAILLIFGVAKHWVRD